MLLQEIRFAAVRGNAGEMAQLAGVAWAAKGVDAGCSGAELGEIAVEVAKRYGTVAVVSGKTDYVSDGLKLATLHNGTVLLLKITTSGCLLSAVCGAFLAVVPDDYLAAAIEACTVCAAAAEYAADGLQPTQSGTFMIRFMDSLAAITEEQVAAAAKVHWRHQ